MIEVKRVVEGVEYFLPVGMGIMVEVKKLGIREPSWLIAKIIDDESLAYGIAHNEIPEWDLGDVDSRAFRLLYHQEINRHQLISKVMRWREDDPEECSAGSK